MDNMVFRKRISLSVFNGINSIVFATRRNIYKLILALSFAPLLVSNVLAQTPTGSNIWLARLNVNTAQPISDLVAITNNKLYTNQPYFFDNSRLFYTQMVEQEETEQSDIMLFDIALGKIKNLTQSASSEYSPTPLVNKPGMSVIRVNELGKQELWELNPQGKPILHLAPHIEPVGYQVWLSGTELLLFVLGAVDESGELAPHQLQRVSTAEISAGSEFEVNIIDKGIGASLYRYKKTDWFLYSKDMEDEGNWLFAYQAKTGKTLRIATLPQGSNYFAISPSGIVFTSDGKQLWQRQIIDKTTKLSPQQEWNSIKIEENHCQSGISRIAISPDESMIAMVCPHHG